MNDISFRALAYFYGMCAGFVVAFIALVIGAFLLDFGIT